MNNDALKDLHTAIVDAREGYATAIKDTEDPALRSLFQEMDQLHASAHSGLHQALATKGQKPDDSGSFMGTVHKTVISVRSAVTGLGHGSLGSFADGEDRIIEKYDEAIHDEDDANVRGILETQRKQLSEKVAKMRRLHDQPNT